MSTLRFEKMRIPSADLGGLSSLPAIAGMLTLDDFKKETKLDEDDGLYSFYGEVETAFPYRSQDLYDRSLVPKDLEVAVLENEYLKATFAPSLGGKLWSLIDKTTGKNLLFTNSVIRPCNLAERNAWLSGGVEWNAGLRGHHPFTCSQVFTAQTRLDDGTPVLRFYYYERIRSAVVQIDTFLPDRSKMLFVRIRITNPNADTIPMYWWSNMAVVSHPGDRVIVPAHEAFTSDLGTIVKIATPKHKETDVSYPLNVPSACDFFWKTDDKKRKYICQLGKDGYGLVQTSTDRLKGRKLFVWGNSQGGEKWQNFLTADGESGSYDEIQAGLARTQYECLPMPPFTVWEWAEGYGAMQADPEKIHGDYDGAIREAEERLDAILPAEALEKLLTDTRPMAKRKAEKTLAPGEGFAALELLRLDAAGYGRRLMCDHLDFGCVTEEQKDFLSLLQKGTVGKHSPDEVPAAYQIGDAWLSLLEKAMAGADRENFFAYYLYGAAMVAKREFPRARAALERSLSLTESAYTRYALAILAEKSSDREGALREIRCAHRIAKGNLSLAKEFYRLLGKYECCEESVSAFADEPENIKNDKRCLLFYANSLAKCGKLREAYDVLVSKNGEYLVVPDIRECEMTVPELWQYLCDRGGIPDGVSHEIPRDLDFRMQADRTWF